MAGNSVANGTGSSRITANKKGAIYGKDTHRVSNISAKKNRKKEAN
jgi:hypothetical protein